MVHGSEFETMASCIAAAGPGYRPPNMHQLGCDNHHSGRLGSVLQTGLDSCRGKDAVRLQQVKPTKVFCCLYIS